MLQREIDINKNDRSYRLSLECYASLPDLENKAKIWDIITQPTSYNISYYDYGAYIEGFFCRSQVELMNGYLEEYIKALPTFAEEAEKEYMSIFTDDGCPKSGYVTQDFLMKLKATYEKYEEEDPLKYDSFIRLLKGRYELLSGYERIKDHAEEGFSQSDTD